jgi:N-acyl-D-amino-acid deacylase
MTSSHSAAELEVSVSRAGTTDILIRAGLIVDGTGTPGQPGDVLLSGGTVQEVVPGGGLPVRGRQVVDASEFVVTPGFIDIHTHCDYTLPRFPGASSMVRQGVTTVVTGNCGMSPFPVGDVLYGSFLTRNLTATWRTAAEYFAVLDELPLAVNVAPLVGHGSIRSAVLGPSARVPDDRELAAMEDLVVEAFRAGVFGLSSGLVYAPGCYAEQPELVALTSVAASFGGFYATHLRDEGMGRIPAMHEAAAVARAAGAPLQLSHHKALGRASWGSTAESLALIDRFHAEGLDVLSDQYPYTATSTTLEVYLPAWTLRDGHDGLHALLSDPSRRARIAEEIRAAQRADVPGPRPLDPTAVLIAGIAGTDSPLAGTRLADVDASADPVEVMLELLHRHGDRIEIVAFNQAEEDVRRVLHHPLVSVASDGWVLDPEAGGTPHPRSYGTFARVLGHYVREEGVLPLETAVHKMTQLPARRLPGTALGTLTPGAPADIVVFDRSRVEETSTYARPHSFARGVEHVLIAGEFVVRNGRQTAAAPGRVLRGPGTSS